MESFLGMNECDIVRQLVMPLSLPFCDMYLEANTRVNELIKNNPYIFDRSTSKAHKRRLVNSAMRVAWSKVRPSRDWNLADNSGFLHLEHTATGLILNLRAADWVTKQAPESSNTRAMRARYTQGGNKTVCDINVLGMPDLSDVALMLVGDDSDFSKPFLTVYKPVSPKKKSGIVQCAYMFDLAHTSEEIQQNLQFTPEEDNEDLLSLIVEEEIENSSITH